MDKIMLCIWMLAWGLLLLLSMYKLRNEFRSSCVVKRCDDCGWCASIPESAGDMFLEGERLCHRGRGNDINLAPGQGSISVVWDDSYCDDYTPLRKRGNSHA